jgi:sodium/proline symporter
VGFTNNINPYTDISAIIAFVGYLMLVMLVGVIAYMVTRNLSDYVLGGRRLGGAVAALSAGASDMSSWLLMGLPGAVYISGLSEAWVAIGLTIGAYASWRLVAKRLRIYSEIANDSVTLPAFLDNRFRDNSKSIRLVAAVAILIFFVFYVAAGFTAGAILLSRTFDLSYTQGLWLGAAIIMLYTSFGGFLAVSWTDFFQGTLMLFCLLLVPLFTIHNMGGFASVVDQVKLIDPQYLHLTRNLNVMGFISLFSWGLGYFGMPHIIVRYMSVKTVRELPLARRVCISWMALAMVGAILVGMVGVLHFKANPLENHETVFMALSEQVFSPWVMGIVLAAIMSSSMCAVDSQMLAASSALTEDFYHAILRRKASQKELVWVGRIACVLIALVALYLARTPSQTIMKLVSYAWAGLGSTFGAVVVLSLFWRRTTRNGVVAGMVLGAFTVILWHSFGGAAFLYEIVPGTIASYLGTIVVSLLDKKPRVEIEKEFDHMVILAKQDAINLTTVTDSKGLPSKG